MTGYRQDNGARGEGIALAHTIAGEPVMDRARQHNQGPNVEQATWSTAPYKPPKRRNYDNPDLPLCAEEDCRAYPMKTTPYCAAHARSKGLLPHCSVEGCHAAPMKGTEKCYGHTRVKKERDDLDLAADPAGSTADGDD
jgi:hypothetical protein